MDGRLLKSKVVLNGLKVDELLELVNKDEYIMDRNRYYRCMRGDDEFDRKEIQAMSEALNLTDAEMLDIFFKEEVS